MNLKDSRTSQNLLPRNLLTDSELERAHNYKRMIDVQYDTQKRREKEELMEEDLNNKTKLIPEDERKYLT